MSDGVDDINQLLAEAEQSVEDSYYECLECDEWVVSNGHRARRHALKEHGTLDAIQKKTVE